MRRREFVRTVARGIAAGCGGALLAGSPRRAEAVDFGALSGVRFMPELAELSLAAKAQAIQELIERTMFDPSGLMYSMLLITGPHEVRPVGPQDVVAISSGASDSWKADPWINECFRNEWMTFENSLTTAGIYLHSQVERYRVTQSADALEQARRAFESIHKVYELGVADGNPGWLSKPYGRAVTNISSPDQYFFSFVGLFNYAKVADPDTQAKITQLVTDAADYARKDGYDLFWKGPGGSGEGELWPYNAIFMLINSVAYHLSGEPRYREELLRLDTLGRWKQETYIEAWRRAGHKRVLMFERVCLAAFAIMSGEIIFEATPEVFGAGERQQQAAWSRAARRWWEFSKLGVDEDYYAHYWVDINVEGFDWRPTGLTEPNPNMTNPDDLFMNYHSDVRWGDSLYRNADASLSVSLASRGIRRLAAEFAREVLRRTSGDRLRWMIDLDGKQLLPPVKYMGCMLSSEAPYHYLAMYWRGRRLGYW